MSTFQVYQPTRILSGASAHELLQFVDMVLDAGTQIILIDLQHVMFMDSSGLGALVTALRQVKARNGQLYLCTLRGQAAMLFETTNMSSIFQVFADQKEFRQAVLPTPGG